jgi:glyoxylase I family protein
MANNMVGIHHGSLIVKDTARALQFYQKILGLTINPDRPELGYPGAWLDIGNQQIHLLEVQNPYSVSSQPRHGGRDRHLALQVYSLDEVINRLDDFDYAYSKSKSGRAALFVRDPDGNAIELIETK